MFSVKVMLMDSVRTVASVMVMVSVIIRIIIIISCQLCLMLESWPGLVLNVNVQIEPQLGLGIELRQNFV